jgi:hypothetical protein
MLCNIHFGPLYPLILNNVEKKEKNSVFGWRGFPAWFRGGAKDDVNWQGAYRGRIRCMGDQSKGDS